MLWGALNNATQGMMATSWDMGSISQNIANLNTVGYKRKESLFKTVLSETKGGTAGGLDIFAVKASDRYHLQAQGVLTPTYHWSDLAINGRGFFMVSPPTTSGAPTGVSTDDPNAVLYTRAGMFEGKAGDNGRSYLVTGEGYHLMGWAYDATGTTLTTSLSPVYTMPETTMEGSATTTAQIIANLPAGNAPGPTAHVSTQTIQDGNGIDQKVDFTWTRVDGQTWSVSAAFQDPTVGTINSGASYTVTRDPFTGAATSTPASADLDITWSAANGGTTVIESLGGLGSMAPALGSLEKIYLPVFDATFGEHSVALGFERGPASAAGNNTWYMHMQGGTSVQLEFDGDGQMVTAQPLQITANFTSGTPPVITTQAISVDLSKMTAYDGPLYIGEVQQDGYGQGDMRYARFNDEGDLEAFFTNGESRKLFRVPVATFRSENNLSPLSGTLYARTAAAGDIFINSVADAPGGGGTITAEAVENSTVDIEEEFTRMIMTQKAYSTNATVFRTADEMTTTVRDLKT